MASTVISEMVLPAAVGAMRTCRVARPSHLFFLADHKIVLVEAAKRQIVDVIEQ